MASPARSRPKVVTQQGEPVVHFDADAVEEEANEEPFVFSLGGKVFTMRSPEDAGWQASDGLGSPGGVRQWMEDLLVDGVEDFAKIRCSQKKLNKIIEACQRHYGVTPGESAASARS